MNCKKIQKIIMTDYIDSEASQELKKRISQHLENCPSCAEFERLVRKQAVEPLKGVSLLKPSESVWQTIRQRIEASQPEVESFVFRPRRSQRLFFGLSRPVFALVSALVLLVIISPSLISFTRRKKLDNYLKEQVVFYSYLDNGSDNGIENGLVDFGTLVEEYFL